MTKEEAIALLESGKELTVAEKNAIVAIINGEVKTSSEEWEQSWAESYEEYDDWQSSSC